MFKQKFASEKIPYSQQFSLQKISYSFLIGIPKNWKLEKVILRVPPKNLHEFKKGSLPAQLQFFINLLKILRKYALDDFACC